MHSYTAALAAAAALALLSSSPVHGRPEGSPLCVVPLPGNDPIAKVTAMTPATMTVLPEPYRWTASDQTYTPGFQKTIKFQIAAGGMYRGIMCTVTDSNNQNRPMGTFTPPLDQNGLKFALFGTSPQCLAAGAESAASAFTHVDTKGINYVANTFQYTTSMQSTGTLSLNCIMVQKCNVTNVFSYQYMPNTVQITPTMKQGTLATTTMMKVPPMTCPPVQTILVTSTCTVAVTKTATVTPPPTTVCVTATATTTSFIKQVVVKKCQRRPMVPFTPVPPTTPTKQGTKATTTACCQGEIGTGAKGGTGGATGGNAYAYGNAPPGPQGYGNAAPAYGNNAAQPAAAAAMAQPVAAAPPPGAANVAPGV